MISVCIPVLNEAARLPRLVKLLRAQRGVSLEIIVADGGSTDGSLAALPPDVTVVAAPSGRGIQMNAAAGAARGDDLLFLHADSQPLAPDLLARALAALDAARRRYGHDRVAGHFRLRFARRGRNHALAYRYMEEKTGLNRPDTINGDQGLLLARGFFESLGRFDTDLPLLEDQRIAERIRATGVWITLPGALTTSARRFEALGVTRVYTFMATVMAAWRTDNAAFLAEVPALYRAPLADGRLDMGRVLATFRNTQRMQPLGARWQTFLAGGRYLGDNAWQAFFFFDVAARPLLGPGRYPVLRIYDRVPVYLMRNPVAHAVLAALVYLWVLVILRIWYAWRDKERRRVE